MIQPNLTGTSRIQSVDILRGAIMVLMAIDHVRVYAGVPAGGPDPAIFFTRWVTHFCAPGFVFFAGSSAFLYGRKLGDFKKLSRYLVTRGLLLVILELTFIRFSWAFHVDFSEFILAGVIWMLGWCMVLLALFVRMRPIVVASIGLAIIFFQQLFALVPRAMPESVRDTFGSFWEIIYSSGYEAPIEVLYVLVPWIGVMMAGYGFGTILLMEPAQRNRLCLWIGLGATALFVVAGSVMVLIQPPNPEAPPFIMRLLNQQKYPASQFFLLMTIGPAIALVPLAEKAKGWFAHMLSVFGKVPFFYYLLHILLIHFSALIVTMVTDGVMHHDWYTYSPYTNIPPEGRWSLPLLYMVFVIDVAILYAACAWYVKYKFSHSENKWLKFV